MEGIIKNFKTLIGDVEMTPYKVITRKKNYEERVYPAQKWICACSEGCSREEGINFTFRLLFNYISGKNKENVRLDMTAPVTTLVEDGGGKSADRFTMAFYVPQMHQDNPPEPIDSSVFFENRPQMTVFASRYGGFSTDDVVKRQTTELLSNLSEANERGVDTSKFYIVGYDPPYKPIKRRNEIWFVKHDSLESLKSITLTLTVPSEVLEEIEEATPSEEISENEESSTPTEESQSEDGSMTEENDINEFEHREVAVN